MKGHTVARTGWKGTNGWKRTAGGAIIGTAVAGGLLLSGSAPTLANGVPAGTVARAAVPSGTGYWLTDASGKVYPFGNAVSYGSMAGKHLNALWLGSWLRRTARATGWWPRTAACLPSAQPGSTTHCLVYLQRASPSLGWRSS